MKDRFDEDVIRYINSKKDLSFYVEDDVAGRILRIYLSFNADSVDDAKFCMVLRLGEELPTLSEFKVYESKLRAKDRESKKPGYWGSSV